MSTKQKIFFIGFNKTATSSFHDFFINNKYRSVHWMHNDKKVINIMLNNIKNNRNILFNVNYRVYLDFMHDQHLDIYKELYKQYPNAKFILQLRNKEKWIASRLNAGGGNYIIHYNKYCSDKDLTVPEVVKLWSEVYDQHINDVKDFFSDKNNLYIYNIDDENRRFDDLLTFILLEDEILKLRIKHLPRSHISKTKKYNVDDIKKYLSL